MAAAAMGIRDPTCGMVLHVEPQNSEFAYKLAQFFQSRNINTSISSDFNRRIIFVHFRSGAERDYMLHDKELLRNVRVTRLEEYLGHHLSRREATETTSSQWGVPAEVHGTSGHAASGQQTPASIQFVSATVLDYIDEKIQTDDISRKERVTFQSDKTNMTMTVLGGKQNIISATQSVFAALKDVAHHEISMEGIDKLKMLKAHKGDIAKDKNSKIEIFQSCKEAHPVGIQCRVVLPGGRILSVFEGDVFEHHIDAMVTTAPNKKLKGSEDYPKTGDSDVQRQIDEVFRERSLKEGACFITGPGHLPCKIMIHAVGPPSKYVYPQIGIEESRLLETIITLSLREANLHGLNSIAIPTVLAQQYGFLDDACAKIIVTAIVNFCKDTKYQGRSVRDIRVVDKEGKIAKSIADSLNKTTNKFKSMLISDAVNETLMRFTTTTGQSVVLVRGSLEEEQTNVIVNSTGEKGELKRGAVSIALLSKAGPDLQKQLTQQMGGYLLQEGSSIVTTGCNLGCTFVYHVMVYNKEIITKEQEYRAQLILKDIVKTCLKTAQDKQQKSISFPALGAGTLQHPIKMVAATMIKSVIAHFKDYPNSSLKNVRFVLYPKDYETIKEFQKNFTMEKDNIENMHGNKTSLLPTLGAEKKIGSSPVTVIQMAGNASDVAQAKVKIENLLEEFNMQSAIPGAIVTQPVIQASVNAIQQPPHSGGATGGMPPQFGALSTSQAPFSSGGATGGMASPIGALSTSQAPFSSGGATGGIASPIGAFSTSQAPFSSGGATGEMPSPNGDFSTSLSPFTSGGATGGMFSPNGEHSGNQEPSSFGQEFIFSNMGCDEEIEAKELKALSLNPREYRVFEHALKHSTLNITSISQVVPLDNKDLENKFGDRHTWISQRDGNPVTCRILFQGINENDSKSVEKNGFKRARPGINGHRYGRGIYFYTDVHTALTHGADGGARKADAVVVARVMTGKHCLGQQGMLAPPPIQQSDPTHLHDSTVDNLRNPQVFVVFNSHQAYPMFYVTLKDNV
ncbi:protein mono-ADP-ribosyltransferase PARP14-like isoform X2 [Lethenteron reissneri]|uniref:protein mono-ADP-ribosyltransferase PARP14-like isoform X2 n=1 Tax=Lethenteron reissneri TaxID=7753 RepID=UPI002AB5F0F4|nr:protein mono-ADP-ribosyltransferase PARP14-like isoform X2 [Lethenteron reissneri]